MVTEIPREPKEISVRRLSRGLFRDVGRWEAEVQLGFSPNFTTVRAFTKGGAIREARRIYKRSLEPTEIVPL